jgi:hypothetical protein
MSAMAVDTGQGSFEFPVDVPLIQRLRYAAQLLQEAAESLEDQEDRMIAAKSEGEARYAALEAELRSQEALHRQREARLEAELTREREDRGEAERKLQSARKLRVHTPGPSAGEEGTENLRLQMERSRNNKEKQKHTGKHLTKESKHSDLHKSRSGLSEPAIPQTSKRRRTTDSSIICIETEEKQAPLRIGAKAPEPHAGFPQSLPAAERPQLHSEQAKCVRGEEDLAFLSQPMPTSQQMKAAIEAQAEGDREDQWKSLWKLSSAAISGPELVADPLPLPAPEVDVTVAEPARPGDAKERPALWRAPTIVRAAGKDAMLAPEDQGVPCRCVVRGKENRLLLQGFDCEQCRKYYQATKGVGGRTEAALPKASSRHRFRHAPTCTPPGFWDLSFPRGEAV